MGFLHGHPTNRSYNLSKCRVVRSVFDRLIEMQMRTFRSTSRYGNCPSWIVLTYNLHTTQKHSKFKLLNKRGCYETDINMATQEATKRNVFKISRYSLPGGGQAKAKKL